MAAQLLAHAEGNSVGISAGHSGARWSEANCSGKPSHASAVGRVQERYEAFAGEPVGSVVLDWADDALERLEIGFGDCAAEHGDGVAAQALQTILVEIVAAERARATAREFGDSETGQDHGSR